jgi:hypothetical protein
MNLQQSIDLPLRFVVSRSCDEEGLICCPLCGGDYVHLGQISVQQGQTQTVIGRERTETKAAPSGKRGSAVAINFVGECGHAFTYAFEFHKGQTSAGLSVIDVEPGEWPETLWRN